MTDKLYFHSRLRQSGFSFLEVIVTIGLVTMLYSVMMQGFGPAVQFRAKIETEARLKTLRTSLLTAYKDNMTAIDGNAGQVLDFGSGVTIAQQLPGANNRCPSTTTTLAPIARYLDRSSTRAHLDGYNQAFCLYITPRQALVVDGVSLNYHSVAVVSAGQNGVVETGSTLSATGELTLTGDDLGVLMDGRSFVQGQFQVTLDGLRRTADAYQAYFQARYQADPGRSVSIDYFSCGVSDCATASNPHWDMSGAMPSVGSGSSGAAMNSGTAGSRPFEILGLSQSDVTDGFGNVLLMQNQGNLCRNPANASATLQSPPFTAVIYTDLPGGTRVSQTVIGLF